MVKKISAIVLSGILLGLGIFFVKQHLPPMQSLKQDNVKSATAPTRIPAPTKIAGLKKTISVFIPYWSCGTIDGSEFNTVNRIFYFGVAATRNGVNKSESGYTDMQNCLDHLQSVQNKILTLRMLDGDINSYILQNSKAQNALIADTVEIAQKNNFNGIAVDLEFGSNFLVDNSTQITEFTKRFYAAAKQANLKFIFLTYGDSFVRMRSFDLGTIKDHVDELMIMAYDLHKARGEPGPNFPLTGKEKFGYDFQTMVGDFEKVFPPEKLSVVFGMYGYDWSVDENKKPIRPAKSMTLNEIRKTFLDKCEWKNCLVTRDKDAVETEVDYVDQFAGYHIVWFEDQESMKRKMDFLEDEGIGNTAIWAYGYY